MRIKYDYLIALFFFSAVIGVGLSYSVIYFFHLMLIVCGVSYLYINNMRIRLQQLPTKLQNFFYFMFSWSAISLIWSINKVYTLYYLVYLTFGIFIVLSTIYYASNLNKQIRLFKILSFAFLFEILVSLIEALTHYRWPISPFSPYASLFGRDGSSLEYNDNLLRVLLSTPTGFQWNPNDLGAVMNLLLPFFLFSKNVWVKFAGSFSVFVVIMFIASRANFFAFLILLVSYLLFYNAKRAVVASALIASLSIVLCFGFAHFRDNITDDRLLRISYLYEDISHYLSGEYESHDSIGIRKQLIKNGMTALFNTYGLGVGAGSSKAIEASFSTSVIINEGTKAMHNFWIELLVEGGFLLFGVFCAWYFYMAYRLRKICSKCEHVEIRYYSSATSLAMVGFIPAAISASSVIYLLPMWLMFGFAIATINNYERLTS